MASRLKGSRVVIAVVADTVHEHVGSRDEAADRGRSADGPELAGADGHSRYGLQGLVHIHDRPVLHLLCGDGVDRLGDIDERYSELRQAGRVRLVRIFLAKYRHLLQCILFGGRLSRRLCCIDPVELQYSDPSAGQ